MAEDPRPEQRIAKLLARAGVASRREVERMIAEGRVALNGTALDTPATLLRSLHGVTVDGQPVAAPAPARLFLFHKPPGLLTTERDPGGRPTIYDRLPSDLPRLVPVGRLDLATEGLLLLTTDGGLKRQLELPATGVERAYRARAYGDITQAQLEELIEGVEIDGMRYGPIDANLERRTGANVWIELILTEGKNREVRRVLEHLGLQVSRLIRTRYGPFVLGDLQPGEIGEVRQHDLVAFRKSLGKKFAPDQAVAVAAHSNPPRAPLGERDRAQHGGGAVATRADAGGRKSGPRRDQPKPAGDKASPPAQAGVRRPRPSTARAKSASGAPPRTSSGRLKEPQSAREGELDRRDRTPRSDPRRPSPDTRHATRRSPGTDAAAAAKPSKTNRRPPRPERDDNGGELTTSRRPPRPNRPAGPPPRGPRRPGKR